jgi:hypothetical protein
MMNNVRLSTGRSILTVCFQSPWVLQILAKAGVEVEPVMRWSST